MQKVEDAEKLRKWRCSNQSEMDSRWKIPAERMEEEVLDKYKVEERQKRPFRGRGAPLEWRWVRENKRYRLRKWGEDCWARIFSLFGEYNLQHRQRKQEKSMEDEEMKQKQRMVITKDLIRKIGSKGRMDAENRW